jgi:hypothetical protein
MLTLHGTGGGGSGGGDDPDKPRPIKNVGGHYIDLFITDVLLMIMEYLEAEDLVRVRSTSGGLKRLVDDIFNRDPQYIEGLYRTRHGDLERRLVVNIGQQQQRALVDHALRSLGRLDLFMEHISRLPNSRVTYRLPRSPFMRFMPDTQQYQQGRDLAIRELQGRANGQNWWAIIFLVLLVVVGVFILYVMTR